MRTTSAVTAGMLAVALLGGCAADRAPPVPERVAAYCPNPPAIPVNAQGLVLPPPILVGGSADWETDFASQLQFTLASPSSLAGKWPETARALAQLQMLGNAFANDLRFQTMPGFGILSMHQGVRGLRASLGIPAALSDVEVAGAFLRTECALWARDRAAAQAALTQVASVPDALQRIAPEDNTAPQIPTVTAAAAAQALRAMQLQADRRRP